MRAGREELPRAAARLFAERGYHGTSLADIAAALGIQKASLYHHIASKEDLLWEVARSGADAFHAALDGVPEDSPATERIRIAFRGHLRVVAARAESRTRPHPLSPTPPPTTTRAGDTAAQHPTRTACPPRQPP